MGLFYRLRPDGVHGAMIAVVLVATGGAFAGAPTLDRAAVCAAADPVVLAPSLQRRFGSCPTVVPGDKVSVRGHPSRDGSKLVHMEYLTLPDGTERFTEDLRTDQFEDRRRRSR